MKLTTSILLFLFSITYAYVVWATVATNSPTTKKFITLADIHFDPFSSCKEILRPCSLIEKLRTEDFKNWDAILANNSAQMPSFTEDTNFPLLQATLLELQKINQIDKPQFVLILGDFLAHRFKEKYKKFSSDKSLKNYNQFINKTFQFLTYELNRTFPNINVYPVIGNNDTYTSNYNVVPRGEFLNATADILVPLIKDKKNQFSFLSQFPNGGYYSIVLPNNQKILVLNTVLFSSNSNKNNIAIAAKDQLEWLRNQLKVAEENHSSVIFAFHIPEDVDTLTSIKMYLLSIKKFWKSQYTIEYDKIIKQFANTIVAIFPAHTHINSYRVNHQDTQIPVIFTPSISPVYGNDPGFNVVSYNFNTLHIEEYVTYFYSKIFGRWDVEYSFNQIQINNPNFGKVKQYTKTLSVMDSKVYYHHY
jgi:sphingomyelin phosphodiesterase acid-like 3